MNHFLDYLLRIEYIMIMKKKSWWNMKKIFIKLKVYNIETFIES